MVYRAKKNIKDNVRVKLDLTKKRYNVNTSANKSAHNINLVKSCYVDVNCRPNIEKSDDSVNDNFFHSLNNLKSMFAIEV